MLTDSFRDLDRVFDGLLGRDFYLPALRSRRTPAYDLVQKSDCYELSIDLPGVKPEDVKLEIEGNTLKIDAERRAEERKETETILVNNRSYGRMSHAFTLTDDVDASQVQAHFDHGTLTVSLKKRVPTQPRRIEIRAKTTDNRSKIY
jgi:HSP20 family protein